MKILVFSSTFPRWKNDKIPTFVYDLSKRLTKNFDIKVLAPNFPGAKKDEVMDKMKVHRFRYFFKKFEKLAGEGGMLPTLKKNKFYFFTLPFFLMAEFFALKKQVKEWKPDMIHAHWVIPQGFAAALVKKIYGTPYVITSHGSDILGLKGFLGLKRFILKNAKKITVVSEAIKQEILNKIDKDLDIEVIPMGIDTKLFNPNKKDVSIKKKHDIKGKFLLFVGRLAPEKGISELVEAMPAVIKKNPNVKLMIIGKGTLEKELKEKIKVLGIRKNIIFKGWVQNKELPKYYASADVFVCPSIREGSPVSYIESLSCGTPLIVGDIPISREITKKFRGIVVKQNCKDVFKGINLFLEKGLSRRKLNVGKEYDWNNISNKFEEVLR